MNDMKTQFHNPEADSTMVEGVQEFERIEKDLAYLHGFWSDED